MTDIRTQRASLAEPTAPTANDRDISVSVNIFAAPGLPSVANLESIPKRDCHMTHVEDSDPSELLYRFSEAVDQRRPDDAARCFTADGIFRRDASRIIGEAAILDLYRQRMSDPRRKTRHVWSNLVEVERTGQTAVVTAILTNYALEPQVSEDELQMRIGNVRGVLARDAESQWRFAEHHYDMAFATKLPL